MPNISDLHIFLHFVFAGLSSVTSFAYFIKWRNGKAWITIACTILFGYLAWAHLNAFLNIFDRATYGAIYIRPVLHGAYAMVAVHFAYDWNKNKENETRLKGLENKTVETKHD
jgi:hypothetical protein